MSKKNDKFLQVPLVPIRFDSTSTFSTKTTPLTKLLQNFTESDTDLSESEKRLKKAKAQNKWTQTDYRDSEAQTVPWEPCCILKPNLDEKSMLLQLRNLTWGNGLPAGIREVELIKAMQKKQEWQKELPLFNSKRNIKLASTILAALEAIDWTFREKEIQIILDIRMALFDKLMGKQRVDIENKLTDRLHRLNENLNFRRSKTINKIKHNFNRQLRKLSAKYKNRKDFHRELTTSKKSKNLLLDDLMTQSQSNKDDLQLMKSDAFVGTLPVAEKLKLKPKIDNLCIKYTKWNEEKLKTLYEELKNIRLNIHTGKETVDADALKDELKSKVLSLNFESCMCPENDIHYSTRLQSKDSDKEIIQKNMTEDEKYQNIITELKSVHGIYNDEIISSGNDEILSYKLEKHQHKKAKEMKEILDSLEGSTIKALLDFLSKELIKLDDERKTHAYALLVDKTRRIQELVESNEREVYQKYREELDKIFHEIIHIDKKSIEEFLKGVVEQSSDSVTKGELEKSTLLRVFDQINSFVAEENDNNDSLTLDQTNTNSYSEEFNLQIEKSCRFIYEDVFELLDKHFDKMSDDESYQSDECATATNRTYTLNETTQTWETFDEICDEINEADEIVHIILDQILSSIDKIDEDYHVDTDIFSYYYNRSSLDSAMIFEL